ncbi:asparagine-linked glycosylation protein [Reticulomyxa filosa]|uniref:Alpha-1,3-glucosyltransferase n=1 Tax=Reticulomyxa filosa TaxID=46433 RepID=X6NH94_RETFI|nr:asparagine-linked glycosylation protein [Reticulomyxa filosa]|eukprot:ETO25346.1 asparagine-linked glycosylation protein [Reticulomyxa filosa]
MSSPKSDAVPTENVQPKKSLTFIVPPDWCIFICISLVKLLLVQTYHSTDFEVHRNWLAITHSFPLEQWYTENTSKWTLDYPPFFAWFEKLLAGIARVIDEKMLIVSNLNYESFECILFQRFSVILSDLVLFLSIKKYCDTWPKERTFGRFMFESWSDRKYWAVQIITFGNAGLLLVDHIHFQYNGILLGIHLFAVTGSKKNKGTRELEHFKNKKKN